MISYALTKFCRNLAIGEGLFSVVLLFGFKMRRIINHPKHTDCLKQTVSKAERISCD